MNKEDECEIVKDLAIPYAEKLINQGSENFINKHLKTCEDCRKYYQNIDSTIYRENIVQKNTDDIVVNQFKKINRHINCLKSSLVVILILIVTACCAFYIKHQKFLNIINKTCSKIENMEKLDNYKLTVNTIQKDLKDDNVDNYIEYEETYYYKDGKYKVETNNSIKFYEDDSYEKVCVYHDLNTIEYYKQNFTEEKKGRNIGKLSEIANYKELSSTLYSWAFSVREERYNGIECYVIRSGNDKSYRDIWIDKNTFITVRIVNEDYMNFYREEIYTFCENIVTDTDVDIEILNSEKYKNYIRKEIVNNATEETKLIYDLYNKDY